MDVLISELQFLFWWLQTRSHPHLHQQSQHQGCLAVCSFWEKFRSIFMMESEHRQTKLYNFQQLDWKDIFIKNLSIQGFIIKENHWYWYILSIKIQLNSDTLKFTDNSSTTESVTSDLPWVRDSVGGQSDRYLGPQCHLSLLLFILRLLRFWKSGSLTLFKIKHLRKRSITLMVWWCLFISSINSVRFLDKIVMQEW